MKLAAQPIPILTAQPRLPQGPKITDKPTDQVETPYEPYNLGPRERVLCAAGIGAGVAAFASICSGGQPLTAGLYGAAATTCAAIGIPAVGAAAIYASQAISEPAENMLDKISEVAGSIVGASVMFGIVGLGHALAFLPFSLAVSAISTAVGQASGGHVAATLVGGLLGAGIAGAFNHHISQSNKKSSSAPASSH